MGFPADPELVALGPQGVAHVIVKVGRLGGSGRDGVDIDVQGRIPTGFDLEAAQAVNAARNSLFRRIGETWAAA